MKSRRNRSMTKIRCPLHSKMTNRTSDLMMALCNQPEAFASDLGDDQSQYLLTNTNSKQSTHTAQKDSCEKDNTETISKTKKSQLHL